MATKIEPVIARGRRGQAPASVSPSVPAVVSAGGASDLRALLQREVMPGHLPNVWQSSTAHALIAGLWALPIAVVLLLLTYGAFIAYCRANPLEVAAFFGPRPSAELVAPVIMVLLVLAVGMVCGSWLVIRRDSRRVPLVAASACLTLSMVAVIPTLFLQPPPPPIIEQARLFPSNPDPQGRYETVSARVMVEIPMMGDYLLEPSINGVEGPKQWVRLAPGTRIMEFGFPAQVVRRAVVEGAAPSATESPEMVLRLKMSQRIAEEGYRPLHVSEWPFAQDVVDPILRELSRDEAQASKM